MPDPSHPCSNPTQNRHDAFYGSSTGGKSYYSKQEGDWWQQSNSPDRFEDDYSEMETTFMERPTPGGFKSTSAPGQSKSPSVRRTRRDDFEWDSSRDERDRAYMHNVHIRNSDIRAFHVPFLGYALFYLYSPSSRG
jgi:hypothetical protein